MTIRTVTAALATSVWVLGAGVALGQSPQPQSQRPRPTGGAMDMASTDEVVVQGCLSRDTGTAGGSAIDMFLLQHVDSSDAPASGTLPPKSGAAAGAPAQGPTGQHNAHAEAMQADRGASAATDETNRAYRLAPASDDVDLRAHLGHRVEVRGRLSDPDESAVPGGPTRGGSQAVQGGQMQGVGQTMQSGQGGQSGQSTQQPLPGSQAGHPPVTDGSAGPPTRHRILTVTSVRMISPSCGSTP